MAEAAQAARRGHRAARRPAEAVQSVSDSDDALTRAEEAELVPARTPATRRPAPMSRAVGRDGDGRDDPWGEQRCLAARRQRRAGDRGRAAAQAPRRLRRPGPGPRAADPAAAQRAAPRPAAGPRAAVRPARPRQDHDRDDHRRRARRAAADHQRPGDRAVRRPGGRAVHPPGGRGRLHRRDPPPRPPRRGDAVPGDGGLPRRHHRRQGAGRDRDPARHRPVHPGRRDHPGRPAARAAARPVRLHRRTWTSTSRKSSASSSGGRPACSACGSRTAASRSSRCARAARRGSPTGCCAGSATTPRSAPTAWSPGSSPGPRSSSTRSTSSASTGSTGPCSTP